MLRTTTTTTTLVTHLKSKEDPQDLLKELNFNRYNAHIKGKEKSVQQAVERAIGFIKDPRHANHPVLAQLCKQVGMYYLFCLRDMAALTYLEKFRDLSPIATEHHADANLLIAYTKTIMPTYQDPTEITIAIIHYKTLAETTEINLKMALASFLLGLMSFRSALFSYGEDRERYLRHAHKQLTEARSKQTAFSEIVPSVKIELAHTLCMISYLLLAVKPVDNLVRGLDTLTKAKNYLTEFFKATRHRTFVEYTITQAEAELAMHPFSMDPKQAALLLDAVYTEQCAQFGEEHIDLIKTLYLHGQALFMLKRYKEAAEKYKASLALQLKYDVDDGLMMKLTRCAISDCKKRLDNSVASQTNSTLRLQRS